MTPATAARMTAEEFFGWAGRPENAGTRYELVRGEVIEVPPPTREHGLCCWLAIKVLTAYLTRRGAGHLLTNDTGILVEQNPDTLRGADVILFLRDPRPQDLAGKYVADLPDLVVEVFSPSDRPKAMNERVNQYLVRSVPLVWVINPAQRLVWVYRLTELSKALDETDELTGNGVLPDFSCPVGILFPLPTTP